MVGLLEEGRYERCHKLIVDSFDLDGNGELYGAESAWKWAILNYLYTNQSSKSERKNSISRLKYKLGHRDGGESECERKCALYHMLMGNRGLSIDYIETAISSYW